MRLLLIEDNKRLAENTAESLARAGLTVDQCHDMEEAHAAITATRFDCITLDLGLPDGDGLSLLKTLRSAGDMTPVLILTARDAVADRVAGLDQGADDYLVKPFAPEELISRIKALLRRPGHALGAQLKNGLMHFDTISRETHYDGKIIRLSRRETDFLEVFMRRVGRVVSKADLEERLYGYGEEPTPNAIEVTAHRLRKKLDAAGVENNIQTIRGIGYILSEEANEFLE